MICKRVWELKTTRFCILDCDLLFFSHLNSEISGTSSPHIGVTGKNTL